MHIHHTLRWDGTTGHSFDKPITLTVFLIQQSWVMFLFWVQKMVSQIKPQFLSEQFQAPCEKVMESCTAWCKILPFCAKPIMRESRHFEPAWLKREEKKTNFGYLATLQFRTFTMLLHTTRNLDRSWTLKNEWYVAIKVYHFWEIFVSL